MKFSEFLEKAFFYLSVPKCVSCKERLLISETAMCASCITKANVAMRCECPICLKETRICSCVNKHLETHFVKGHIKLYKYGVDEYSTPLDLAIYQIKRGSREDVFDFLAEELAEAVRSHDFNLENTVITNIPRRKSAILRFGVDHARLLAERVAKLLSVEYIALLSSTAKTAQKSLKGLERIANTNFSVINDIDLSKKRVIIVDDIVTTGASVGSAATLIRSMGAKDIYALSVGYAYKHKEKD